MKRTQFNFGEEAGKGYANLFPEDRILKTHLPDSFIINKPKTGEVGGDGYWIRQKGDTIYIAIFDCMGHGHLASIMARTYRNTLEKVVIDVGIEYTGSIIQYVHREIQAKLKGQDHKQVTTGADFGVVSIQFQKRRMKFAGAKIDLLKIDNGAMTTIKGNRMQVGEMFEYRHQYISNKVDLSDKKASFYLATDGVKKLIGGPKDRKMGSAGLKYLLEISSILPMKEQKIKILDYLKEWEGENDSPDDILIIGFEF